MHASATLLLQSPSLPLPISNFKKSPTLIAAKNSTSFAACRASRSSQYSPITEFNLYELLGVDASSDRVQIKEAYRALQKRCHPDIAGPAGHDMAIILNEAYALLSDPNSRMAYDAELSKVADFQGYTGRPIYSVWFGSESEDRAVFVDEVKCVGCLKCALFASKTFAVESVYGRARVVAQWADPEHKIQEAIGSCPVDCISIVDRSKLAAFEFLMSKQPRGRVRIGTGNTVGVRTSDIFNDVEKFEAKYAKHKASKNCSQESEVHIASRASAIQAIQMISNWLYWQSPNTDATYPATQSSQPRTRRHAGPNVKRLKAAAEARKQATTTRRTEESSSNDYWVPLSLALSDVTTPNSNSKDAADRSPNKNINQPNDSKSQSHKEGFNNPLGKAIPLGTGIMAALVVRLQFGEQFGGLEDHVGGSLALAIVNSPWTQVALAGITWYLIGMYIVELVAALGRK